MFGENNNFADFDANMIVRSGVGDKVKYFVVRLNSQDLLSHSEFSKDFNDIAAEIFGEPFEITPIYL